MDKTGLVPVERPALIDKMTDVLARREDKDTQNKRFLVGLTQDGMKTTLVVAGVTIMTIVAAVAGPDGLKQLGRLTPEVAKRTFNK